MFNRTGNEFDIATTAPDDQYTQLPAGNYVLRAAMMRGFYLERQPDFELPKKIYGSLHAKADRILNTFQDRPSTTGVLLAGEKGSGKTLLTKLISTEGKKRGVPTIIINTSYTGDAFNTFLQQINQPAILLFDEFEKTYNKEGQQQLLTLMDGLFSSKKLILLTSNDAGRIDDHMKNRPGRIFYNLTFEGLDHDFIMDFGRDNLKNQEHLGNLGIISAMVKPLNFDMLQAIIEEANRYNEPPAKTLDMLNVKTSGYKDYYIPELRCNGVKIAIDEGYKELMINPFNPFDISCEVPLDKPNKDGETEEYRSHVFGSDSMVGFDGLKGIYDYKVIDEGDTFTLRLTRKPYSYESTYDKYSKLAY